MKVTKLICPQCECEFEREDWYVRRQEKKGFKIFCSRKCSTVFSNRRRYSKRTLKCPNCQKKLILNESDRKKIYCSQKCYKEHQKDRLAELCRENGVKYRDIIIKKNKEFYKNKENHPFYGKHLSEETKEKLRRSRIEYYKTHDNYWKGKTLSEEAKEKMSATRTQNWVDGKYDHFKNKRHKSGEHFSPKMNKEFHYRSSWEEKFMQYFDSRDDIKLYDYEPFRIPYYYKESKRWYVPDFLVQHLDGAITIYEIKPSQFLIYEKNILKFKAAREFCKNNQYKFRVLTERFMKHVGLLDN